MMQSSQLVALLMGGFNELSMRPFWGWHHDNLMSIVLPKLAWNSKIPRMDQEIEKITPQRIADVRETQKFSKLIYCVWSG